MTVSGVGWGPRSAGARGSRSGLVGPTATRWSGRRGSGSVGPETAGPDRRSGPAYRSEPAGRRGSWRRQPGRGDGDRRDGAGGRALSGRDGDAGDADGGGSPTAARRRGEQAPRGDVHWLTGYSWTSSIRVPNAPLGCTKATVVPRDPGRGTSSMTRHRGPSPTGGRRRSRPPGSPRGGCPHPSSPGTWPPGSRPGSGVSSWM